MIQWDGKEIIGDWHGYEFHDGVFMDREYIVVCPQKGTENGKWALKTEYFAAFPETELELLKRGYHVAGIKNKTRWCPDEDTEAQAAFVHFVHETFGLSEKCIPVGMSCGGMQAIYLGGKHPECVSCMYIDAPVVNLLSCPGGLGKAKTNFMDEFEKARGMNIIDLLSFREHPQDFISALVAAKIPVILVAGDSDTVVPFKENGELLKKAYEKEDCVIEIHLKAGADHHPHGLDDVKIVANFIDKYSK